MSTNRKRKGLVLIAVLWIVIVLTVIVAILGRKSRLDAKVCLARMESLRCKWASRAGIEKAVAILNEDPRENDSLVDLWNDNPEDFNDITLERCWFTVRVIDEASKLNVNTATKEQLLGLLYMDEEVADAIIDWRDSDDIPSENGIESAYYQNLPFEYMARNGPFRTLRELLLVRGVTVELFCGEDINLNGRLDYNERDGDESYPIDNGDYVLNQGWAAYLTCYSASAGQIQSDQNQTDQNQTDQNQTQDNQDQNQTDQNQTRDNQDQNNQSQNDQNQDDQTQSDQNSQDDSGQASAQVNVNTASEIVLAALLGGDDDAIRTAQSIISYRDSLAYGIENISELVDAGILSNDMFTQIEDYITVTSNIFTIRCVAIADRNGPYGARLETEAVVDRSTSPCKILYWYQGASN